MANLSRVRQQFTRIAVALGVISLAAGVYVLVPVGATNAEKYDDLRNVRGEYKQLAEQVLPLRALPEKLTASRADIARFYKERLPARGSQVSEELGKLSKAHEVTLSGVKYATFDTDIPNTTLIEMDASISGAYPSVAKFINAVERDKLFFLIDGVELQEQRGGNVKLSMKLETYLRPSTAADFAASKPGVDESADGDESDDSGTSADAPASAPKPASPAASPSAGNKTAKPAPAKSNPVPKGKTK